MDVELTPIEIRALGCLIEKETATPDYYPLTLNALVNACNQKSNRDPQMALSESVVENALYDLRMTHKLAVEVTSNATRVPKYKHSFHSKWHFTPAETAVLCELFLRGPQTAGDLRAHASRLHPLADFHEVVEILHGLEIRDDGPFVLHMPREPGKRERRWAHLFSGEPEIEQQPEAQMDTAADPDRLQRLEEEVASLRFELDELKAGFAEFKTAFE